MSAMRSPIAAPLSSPTLTHQSALTNSNNQSSIHSHGHALDKDITLAGILNELSLCNHRNEQIVQSINQLSQQHSQILSLVDPVLKQVQVNVDNARTEFTPLSNQLNTASLSAASLSSQVRSLDLTQSRVKSALHRVQALLDLKQTINLVMEHKKSGEYEKCARELHRVLYTQALIQTDSNVGKLRELEAELVAEITTVFNDKLKIAKSTNTMPAAFESASHCLTMAKLFTYLNQTSFGLSNYCLIVRRILHLTLTSKSLTLSSQPENALIPYPGLLTSIIDVVAQTIKLYQSPVQSSFGHGTQFRLLQDLTQETDAELVPLIKKFVEDRRLSIIGSQIKTAMTKLSRRAIGAHPTNQSASSSQPKPGSTDFDSVIDSRTLDGILNEICYIAREAHLFDSTLSTLATHALSQLNKSIEIEKKLIEQINQPSNNQPTKVSIIYHLESVLQFMTASPYGLTLRQRHTQPVKQLLNQSLSDMAQELFNHYLSLEHYYLTVNIEKAISIDSHDANNADTLQAISQSNSNFSEANDEDPEVETKPNSLGRTSSVRAYGGKLHSTINQQLSTVTASINQSIGQSSQNILGIGVVNLHDQSLNQIATVDQSFVKRFKLSLTSTLVDDFFFLAQKVIDRTFSLHDHQSVVAMINHVNTAFLENFHAIIVRTFVEYERKYQPQNQSTNQQVKHKLVFTQHADTQGRAQSLFTIHPYHSPPSNHSFSPAIVAAHRKLHDDLWLLIALNHLDQSLNHLTTFTQRISYQFDELLQETSHTSPNHSSNQFTNMKAHVLEELTSTRQSFVNIHSRAIACVVNFEVHPFRRLFDLARTELSYELSEMHYVDRETNDPFVAPLCETVRLVVLPLSQCLSKHNFQSVLARLLQYLATKIEHLVWKKRFTIWGALQLDRELRSLTAFFSQDLTAGPSQLAAPSIESELGVRDKLMRLVQMASLLQLERCNEAVDIYSQSEAQLWRLDESEVRQVLALRVDFSQKEIATLRF